MKYIIKQIARLWVKKTKDNCTHVFFFIGNGHIESWSCKEPETLALWKQIYIILDPKTYFRLQCVGIGKPKKFFFI